MAVKTPSVVEIVEAAKAGERDCAIENRYKCDPDGAWFTFRNTNGYYNSSSHAESQLVARELPLAYKMFTNQYLVAQGWRR